MNFYERYKGRVPLEDLKGLMNVKPPVTIRVNTLKITKEELIKCLEKKGFSLSQHPAHDQALIVLKEPFSVGATTE